MNAKKIQFSTEKMSQIGVSYKQYSFKHLLVSDGAPFFQKPIRLLVVARNHFENFVATGGIGKIAAETASSSNIILQPK